MALEFSRIKLKRAEGYLISDFTYIKNRTKNDTLFLRCNEVHKGCKATAKIADGLAYEINTEHNHLPPDLPSLKFRAVLMDKAKDPTLVRQSLPKIYSSEREKALSQCTSSIERAQKINQLPTFSELETSMRRSRQGELPKAPTAVDGIDIQHLLTIHDSNGDSFLLDHSPPNDPQQIFIFGNRKMIPFLSLAASIHLDGTFWVVPFLFSQLLTIHCFVYGQMFPIFYILLNGKQASMYDTMFQMVFRIMAQHNTVFSNLAFIVSDFESGLISSVRAQFPNQIHRGCFFHFAQAVYRKITSSGFSSAYRQDPAFKQAIRELIALGHVPAQFKRAYLDDILRRFAADQRVVNFVNEYFIPAWFTRYSLQIWDWFMVEVRTNNYVEAFHSALKTYFEQPHLTFYKFISVLKDQEHTANAKLNDRIHGLPPPTPNKTYSDLNERVLRLHAEFYNRFPEHFLSGIASCAPRPHRLGAE